MAEEKKEKFESSYPKGVRIAAIIGVIFLVALYIVTLIAGITTSKAAPELFKMCPAFYCQFCFGFIFNLPNRL